MTKRIHIPPPLTLRELMKEIRENFPPTDIPLDAVAKAVGHYLGGEKGADLLGGDYVQEGTLWVRPGRDSVFGYDLAWGNGQTFFWQQGPTIFSSNDPSCVPPKEEVFELNMVTPLAGWRMWSLHAGLLSSLNEPYLWQPLQAMKAECSPCYTGLERKGHEHGVAVYENCSCGIYATDEKATAEDQDGTVLGEIWGWGRYVRGNRGWRAEFAYPKSFCLASHQSDLVSVLKKYKVPIFVQQPIQVYSPAEDGYDEYRRDNPNWHSGADEDSGAAEDYYEEDDYEEDDE